MKFIYTMFAIVGWAWCLAVGLYFAARYWHRRREAQARGFEVVHQNDKQP